ncbi:hypothetical protein [Neolewinella persica]|uniref:hypothetical protein n=1 Tax=Neolewinella persica TaxID=70998 RepID=UPI00037D57B5|nr:hypothetical protein [Neolewinella persica]
MRTLLTSYPFIVFLAAIVALLYPSCEPADPVVEELPIATDILLDFSDPNTRPGGTGGFRYLYESESFLATYHAWEAWSCEDGPDFFAAWDDTSLTVWLAHCPDQLNLESITAQTGDGTPLPIESWTPVAGAHEPTYQLTLNPANYVDIENGATTINLQFTYL